MTLSDKYEFIRKLGHGACGDVYLVKHRTLNLLRAVKIVSKHHKDSGLILREATIIKNLKYQGIPVIYDIDETPDEYFIYEEYIEGQTLTEYVKDSFLPLKDILNKAICLCSILDYLHHCGSGILHLDLKPDNIMIDRNNQLWLIDYDNAAMQGDVIPVSRGTIGFAPPQAYWGNKPDVSWDIYSLGMIIMYMSEGTLLSSTHKMRHQQLIPVIRKCLHHSRILRYRNVGALLKDLKNILNNKSSNLSNPSLEINVGGTDRGVGTTHFCLCLCSFFNRNGIPCVVINRNRTDSYSKLCADSINKCNISNRIFSWDNTNIITSSMIANTCELSNFKIIINDYGDLSSNIPIDIYVCGTLKPFNNLSHKSSREQLFIIWNLCSTHFFYNNTRLCHSSNFNYRMPCVYDVSKGLNLCDNMFRELITDMNIDLAIPQRRQKISRKGWAFLTDYSLFKMLQRRH